MKLYLSGPMSGIKDLNFHLFHAYARELRGMGYTVFNPAEKQSEELNLSWEDYMKEDLKGLIDCDGIATIPGWHKSRGASLEVFVGTQLGLEVQTADCWLDELGGHLKDGGSEA